MRWKSAGQCTIRETAPPVRAHAGGAHAQALTRAQRSYSFTQQLTCQKS